MHTEQATAGRTDAAPIAAHDVSPADASTGLPPTPGGDRRAKRLVAVTFLLGIVLLLAAVAFTLTRAPARVVSVGTSTVAPGPKITGDAELCQAGETLPAGVSAIRLSLVAFYGARIHVSARSGSLLLSEGRRGPDWTGRSVTVPVKPLARTASNVTLCVAIGPNSEPVSIGGTLTPPSQSAVSASGRPIGERIGVEYLASSDRTWWSRVLSVARHMGIGHALSGTWVVLLIAALVLASGLLAMWCALREISSKRARPGVASRSHGRLTRGVSERMLALAPAAAWVCASIALLNAAAWSLIVPPFQGKDEAYHYAYVQQLAENGRLPESRHEFGRQSPEVALVLRGLHYDAVVFSPRTPAISSRAQQAALTRDVHAGASLRGTGEAGVATSEPPLYYAIQTVPYELARGNVLDQLQLMRLLGALFGAATALLIFLFLREALPRVPWAASAGAICVSLQPLLGSISGSVNPDAMLFTVSAAIFLCLARAFRRGLTQRGAIALGALIAAGFLTKLSFIGLALGVFVALGILAVRAARAKTPGAVRSVAIAAGIGVTPVALYVLRNAFAGHPLLGLVSGDTGLLSPASMFREVSYAWQMYLPRIPGMTHYFAGLATYRDIWFDRSVGLYGWMDTMFPIWVDELALLGAGAVALLCVREQFLRRDRLHKRAAELAAYAAMVLGVAAMVGGSSYLSDVVSHKYAFGEPRYLFPLFPLAAALIVLAVRGAGRRWMPVVGAAMIVLFFGHDIFSQLQTIARYYG